MRSGRCCVRAMPTRCGPRCAACAGAGVPVMFGGEVQDDTLLLTEFFGTRTGGMRGLAVRPSAGWAGPPSWRVARCRWPTTAGPRRSPTTTTPRCCRRASGRSSPSRWWWTAGAGGALRRVPRRGTDRRPDGGSDGRVGPAAQPGAEHPRRGRPAAAAAGGAAGELSAGGADTEEVREVHAELRRLAADPRRRLRARPSCVCSPSGWRGADRAARRGIVGRARSTCWPRSRWAARMPKRRNVFR